jgi:transposase
MVRKYSEEELTKVLLLILDRGMTPLQASQVSGISLRTIQRYKSKYLGTIPVPVAPGVTQPVIFHKESTIPTDEVQRKLDATLLERAKFLTDLFDTKKILLAQIRKIGKKSQNLDAMQKTLKTITELENVVDPEDGNKPSKFPATVNMFQYFNQLLINEGYEGPKIEESDIIKGD